MGCVHEYRSRTRDVDDDRDQPSIAYLARRGHPLAGGSRLCQRSARAGAPRSAIRRGWASAALNGRLHALARSASIILISIAAQVATWRVIGLLHDTQAP